MTMTAREAFERGTETFNSKGHSRLIPDVNGDHTQNP